MIRYFTQINDQVRGKTRGTCRLKMWLTKKNDKTHDIYFFAGHEVYVRTD